MTDAVRELVTRWGFEVNDVPLKRFKESLEAAKGVAEGVGLAVAGAAATVFGFAKLTAEAGDETRKMSQKIGVSVEELGRLQYAAKLADVSHEQLGIGLKLLSKNMYEAAGGSEEAQKSFAAIGVSATAGGKLKSASQVFTEISEKFSKMPDGAKKTALALQVFGRSGAEMIPLLDAGGEELKRLGDEAEQLGVVFSQADAEMSEKFNDTLETAMQAMVGVRNVVGLALMPSITTVVEGFTEWVKINRQLIATRLGEFMQGLITFLKIMWRVGKDVWSTFSGLVNLFGGFERVVKALAWGLGLFGGASVMYALGVLILGVQSLVAWFTYANIAALAIPILIGAAFVALGLIIEDIVNFFQGNDSVTGIIVEKFKAMFAWLNQAFTNAGAGWRVAFTVLLTPLRAIVLAFQTIVDLVDVFRGKTGVFQFLGNQLGRTQRLFGFGGASDSLSGALGFTPATAPAAGSGNTNTMSAPISAPISVVVGENASPMETSRAVKSGVEDGFGALMRGTMRDFQGAGGY